MLALWIFVFVVSLALMVKAADYFTKYAEKLGKQLKLSSFLIGVLIIAVGTSLPELVTSLFGIASGESEFLAANIMGTVIVNILLGLGIAVLLTRKIIKFDWDTVANDMPFMAGATMLLGFSLLDGQVVIWESILLILAFVVYVFYSLQIFRSAEADKKHNLKEDFKEEIKKDLQEVEEQILKNQEKKPSPAKKFIKLILLVLLSLGIVVVAGNYVVESLLEIAKFFGVGSSVLAGSIVAIGTSLPEITVAIAAARRRNFDMVLGNIIGSNIFDILIIFGIPGLFTTLTISQGSLWLYLPFMGAAVLIMWLISIDKKITKAEAGLMVILYLVFLGRLFNFF